MVSLADDFRTDRTLNTNVWIVLHQQGDTSNGEVECYAPSQVTVSRARGLGETEQYMSRGFACPRGTPNSSNPLHWKSGAVQMRSYRFTYGTVVVRAKMAGGHGAWPAIWLLGAACQRPTWLSNACRWPSDSADAAEIDVAEDLGSHGRTTVNENVFSNSLNDSCQYDTGSSLSSRYHNYQVDWTPGSLVFRVDGKTTGCGVTGGNVPSHPMFLIINTAACTTGSTCGYGANPSTFPQTTSIAWVHISR
ncbi:MAG TPA: glycoside hydrolase family 16 protein [Solirubrobacteraceae bacterium]|nr:glycoside hydrolase family 16 protein [Solirubrobacteraceae bacterium]